MATEFNPTDYFAQRVQQNLQEESTARARLNTELAESAVDAKKFALETAVMEKQQALDKKSWAGRAGVDVRSGAGQAINLGANLAEGVVNIPKNIGSGIHTLQAAALDAHIPDEVKAAYARRQQGIATPEDEALLSLKAGDIHQPQYPEAYFKQFENPQLETNLQRIEAMGEALGRAKAVREGMDVSSIVNRAPQRELVQDLEAGFDRNTAQISQGLKEAAPLDVVSGVAGLFANIGASALKNPQAASEFIATNIPQIVLAAGGAPGMALTNIPYAVDEFGKGIEAYQKANGGALPPEAEMRKMAGLAASLAVAETVGDKLTLGGFNRAAGAAKGSVLAPAARVAGATAEGAAGEFATEAYQTAVENTLEGKEVTAKDAYVGGAIGAIAGAGLGGGATALAEVTGNTPEASEKKQEQATKDEALGAAVASGDVSALVDPKSPSYAPERAVQALFANSQAEDATPEVKEANRTKAAEVVASLETERAALASQLSDEEGAKNQALLDTWKGKLAAAKTPEEKARAEAAVEALTAMVETQVSSDDKERRSVQAKLDILDSRLKESRELLTAFEQQNDKDVDVDAEVASITKPASPEAAQASANRLITLSMAAPERLDTKVAEQLAGDASNGLTTAQRAYLRTFSAARQAENALLSQGDVSQRVYHGHGRDVGIAQYRQRVGQALSANDQVLADRHMADLANFAADHQAKATQMKKAYGEVQRTGATVQVLRQKGKVWSLERDNLLSAKEVKANGGWTIHPGTPKGKVDEVIVESKALSTALAELQAAYAVKFQGGSNVEVVPQAQPQTKTSTKPDQKAKAVGGDAKAEAGVPATGGSRSDVEADGVDLPAGTDFNDISDPEMRLNLYRGEGKGNIEGGGWWSFDRADAEQFAKSSGGTVKVRVMSAKDIATKTAQGQGGKRHRVFPELADTGLVAREPQLTEETQKTSVDSGVSDTSTTSNTGGQSSPTESTTSPEVAQAPQSEAQPATKPEERASEPVKPAGQLTVLDSDPKSNQIAESFTQSAGREGDSTQRPLVAVKDFLRAVLSKSVQITEFVSEKNLSEDQKQALRAFVNKAREWRSTIRENLPKLKRAEFKYEDMMQFLLTEGSDGQVDIDENVKTAIAYAGFGYIADEASGPATLKAKAINAILGRGKDSRVSHEAWQTLGKAGTYQHNIIDSLGGAVMDALGLAAKADGPQDRAAKLRVALGAHALKLLEDKGLIQRTTVPGYRMAELREEGLSEDEVKRLHQKQGETDPKIPHHFFAVARTPSGDLAPGVLEIFNATRGTKGILGKLFKVDSKIKLPSLEPITTVQATTSGTQMGVPEEMKAAILKNQAQPRKVRADTMGLLDLFDLDSQHAMMGVTEENDATTHIVNQASVVAKNDGLKREWQTFKEYVGEYLATAPDKLDTPFYLPFNVWKQQRVGIDSAINPQTSKIMRFLLGSPAWTTEIDSTNEEQMNSFYLRVAEGLGMKTERADNQVSIDAVMDKIEQDAVYGDAIRAIIKGMIDKEPLSKEEQAAVVAGVAAGGANLHTLDALIGMVYMLDAQSAVEEGEAFKFTVQMMGEVDGIANGTMLNHVLLGAAGDVDALNTMVNQGGFFELGNEHTQYNQWRGEEGNLDVYESTARAVYQAIQKMFGSDANSPYVADLASIWAISGEIFNQEKGTVTKDGRNLVKGAMNPLAFGSSMDAVVRGMSETFLGEVYAGFEKLAKAKTPATQEEIDTYVGHVNHLIGDTKYQLPLHRPLQWYMDKPLGSKAESQIMGAFADTVGETTKDVVQNEFGEFLRRRNTLNNAAQATYGMYEAVYRGMREAYVEELLAAGEIPKDKNGNRAGDLSKKQEAELERRMRLLAPVVQTTMSKNDKNPMTGMRMAKTKRKQSRDEAYRNITQFGGKKMANGKSSVSLKGITSQSESPGVAMGSALTHSSDSGLLHRTMAERDVLGIHDAAGDGVDGLKLTAQTLNRELWKTLLTYSPLEEVYTAMGNVVVGISNMVADGEMSPQAIRHLQKFLAETAKKQKIEGPIFEKLLSNLKQQVFEANTIKLGAMATWQSVDQYAYQGGNYEVTEADRAAAKKRADAQSSELPTSHKEAATALAGFMKLKPEQTKATPVARAPKESAAEVVPETNEIPDTPEEENVPDEIEEVDPTPKSSPFGALGASQVVSDERLSDAFEAKPVMTGVEALRLAYQSMRDGQDPAMKQFYGQLIQRLSKIMPAGLTVTYVTPKTQFDEVIKTPDVASRGWYVPTTDGNIYVLSPDFADSGLTGEMLLHELLHGVLARSIDNATGEAGKLVADLELVRAKAEEFVKGLPESEQSNYGPAISNVHELVSWGLSNQEFQDNVLKKITLQSKTKTSSLVTGFKSFIDSLVSFIFASSDKTKQQQHYTGMAALISNVSGLINSIEQGQESASAAGQVRSMAATIQNFSTLDIHGALGSGNVSPAFDTHLRNLLGGIVEKLHGPFGAFKAALQANQAQNPMEAWNKALAGGAAPFASKVATSPLVVSEQELHAIEQVEATVRAALADKALTTIAYKELSNLYTEAEKELKGKLAPDVYDFVFGIEKGTGDRSDYLARFAALGLAHEEINKALRFDTDRAAAAAPRTFADRVQKVWEKILAFLSQKVTGTYRGQRADAKLNTLVEQLVDIEAKKRYSIHRKATQFDPMAPLEQMGKRAADSVRAGIVKAAGSKVVRNSASGVVRGTGALARVWANDRVDQFLAAANGWRNSQFKGRQGIVAGLMQEVRGPDVNWQARLREAKKALEQERKRQITVHAKMALDSFENGRGMSQQSKDGISAVFLRLGMHNLVDHFSMAELETMMGDKQALQAAINQFESELDGFARFKPYFIEQANALGYFKATGRVKNPMLMMNAHNIARMYGTPYSSRITEEEAQGIEGSIAALVALYGLEYVEGKHLTAAKDVLEKENQRSDKNGVEFLLKLHRQMEADSLARNFGGRATLMMHGYTPEIYNPHTEIRTANEAEGEDLVAMGYVKQDGPVAIDPADPDGEVKHIYVLKDGGLQPHLTGIISYTGKNAKGSKSHSGYMNILTADGLANASKQADITHDKMPTIPGMFRAGPRRNLRDAGQTYLAPIVNEMGEVVNYRYLMHDSTKDTILERNNSFDKIIGALAGSIYDKATTEEQNAQTVEALHDQYQADLKAGKLDGYLTVGPKSPDPKLREIWALLPDQTREDVRDIWGVASMMVKAETLDIVFGYRKYSISESFKKDPANRNYVEKHFAGFIEHLYRMHARGKLGMNQDQAEKYAKRAAVHAAKGERVWQEIVRETKDIIVVRSGVVLLGNIWSNFSLLALSGVPFKDMLSTSLVALKGATAYQQDTEELSRLQTLLDTEYTQGQEAEIRRQILRLEDALARNPVKELIDAGLMPTIVEDVGQEEDPYSYKTLLARKTDRFTEKLNPMVKSVGKAVYMTRDSKAYQGLSRITQLSDFVARYTLYQHLINRKNNPLSKADAIQEASDSFVNYDIPMHRALQYTDDMGLTMFTKYFLRIQRVLLRLSRDNPTRVLLAVALNNFMNLGPIVLDSTALTRIGNNPLEWGAFQYPGTLDELATIQAGMSLVK